MIEKRQEQIDKLYSEYFGHTRASEPLASANGNGYHPELSDDLLVALASGAKNGVKFEELWGGNTSGYDSHSEADLALVRMLAFYTQDEAQLDSLFRRSGLYREKWDRGDYSHRTIAKALEGLRETYTVPATASTDAASSNGAEQASPSLSPIKVGTQGRERNGARRLKAVRFTDMPPPEDRRYLVDGLIPEGYPTVIYGDGGAAKSMLALSLGAAVARGDSEWLGLKVQQASTLYVDFELDAQEQKRRAYCLTRGVGLQELPDDLYYLPALGCSARDAFKVALEECNEHGIRLAVIDSVGLALDGDSEAARDVIRFHNDHIEPFRAAGVTVVMVDHQSKHQKGQDYKHKTAFGSVYKGNLARSVIQVEPGERGQDMLTVCLRQTKHNFGPKAYPVGAKLNFSEQRVTVEAVEPTLDGSEGGKEPNATDRVRRALEEGSSYPEELAKATGLSKNTVQNKLTELRKRGEVEPTGERRGQARQVRLVSLRPSAIRDGDRDTGSMDQ